MRVGAPAVPLTGRHERPRHIEEHEMKHNADADSAVERASAPPSAVLAAEGWAATYQTCVMKS
jgi:hypothetical protein